MKSVIASLVAVAGLSAAANAVVNTSIVQQVSLDGTNWLAQVNVNVGLGAPATTNVFFRTLVSYTGVGTPAGLASFVYQPTMSNALATDTFLPFFNGGVGGNTSTPVGVLTPAQGADTTSFGRLSPWGRTALSSTSALHGFFHANPNGDGINFLRIAQLQVTSWIGGAGNTTGGSGVPISQLSDVGRTTNDPPFNTSLASVFVFKWGVTLTTSDATRVNHDMVSDAPLAGFGNRNTANGDREIYWFTNTAEATGGTRGTPVVTTGLVHFVIPSPASLALLGLGGLAVGRRRR
jgi:uncharacterized protein (TIGR03382 family)